MALKDYCSQTESIFKQLNFLTFVEAIFMHEFRINILSFSGLNTDATDSDEPQTRHKYYNVSEIRKGFKIFPFKIGML